METKNDDSALKKSKKSKFLITALIIGAVGILVFSYAYRLYVAFWQYYDGSKAEIASLKSEISSLKSDRVDLNVALSVYREANKSIGPPQKNEKRVVFIGDSITDHWDNPDYGGFFPDKAYINRGIGGQTTPQILVRFRPDVIELNPKVVVILAGTNDIDRKGSLVDLKSVEDNLVSMVELARFNGIRIVLASVLPVNDYTKDEKGNPIVWSRELPIEKIKALNSWIEEYAGRNNITYLDYYSAMSDEKGFLKPELSDDGVHPNAKGYSVMAPLAENAINSALEMKVR